MKCIINGRLVLPEKVAEGQAIIFSDKIEAILPVESINLADYEVIDAKGKLVAPGLVDIHIHGYLGEDASDGKDEGLKVMAAGIAKNGVTSWCPTTMTIAMEEIKAAFDTARRVKAETEPYGAKILGINCEGPFVNPSKKGAQPEEYILPPDGDFIIENADIVVTGEGRLDSQSLMGKVPFGVASRCKGKRIVAVVGVNEAGENECNAMGIGEVIETNPTHLPFEEIKHRAKEMLYAAAEKIIM